MKTTVNKLCLSSFQHYHINVSKTLVIISLLILQLYYIMTETQICLFVWCVCSIKLTVTTGLCGPYSLGYHMYMCLYWCDKVLL